MTLFNLATLVLLGLWLVAILRGLLAVLMLWQSKEYRFDRLRAHLETLQGRRQVMNGAAPLRVVFGLILCALGVWGGALDQVFYAVFIYYFIEFCLTVYWLKADKIKRPKLTVKTISLVALTLLSLLLSAYLFFSTTGWAALPLAHGLVGLWLSVWLILLKPINYWQKQQVFKKAALYRESLKHLTVIGITGSYGKTSTKFFLSQILQSAGVSVIHSPGNTNTDIGLANFLLNNVTEAHSIFIAEMGAYRIGEIARAVSFLKPSIGVITAINDQHVALFGSRANIMKAKYELIEGLPKDGVAIFNDDDEACRTMASWTNHVRVMRYSSHHGSDLSADSIRQGKDKLEFTMRAKDVAVSVQAAVLGEHLTSTFLAASACALVLGLTPQVIARAATNIKVPAATMELRKGLKGATVIDDSYSANPDGVAAALRLLKELPARRRLVVMRPMIELGRYAAAAHRALGEQLAESCDFAFFINQDFEQEIREGAGARGMTPEKLIFENDERRLASLINDFVGPEDVILLENRIPAKIKMLVTLSK